MRDPGIQTVGGCGDTRYVGAETEKGRLPKGNLAGIAEKEVERQRQHGIDSHKNQDIQQVAAGEKNRRDQHCRGEEQIFTRTCLSVPMILSDPFCFSLFKQPLRPDKKDQQEDDKGYGILVSRRDQSCTKGLEHPEKEPAEDCCNTAAHAADDGEHGDPFKPDVIPAS